MKRIAFYTFFFLMITTLLSSCHFVRAIVFLRPDHKDGKKFPHHKIEPAADEYRWSYATIQLNDKNLKVHYRNGEKTSLDSLLQSSKTNAFIIIKNDEILLERYYNNYDESSKNLAFSVTKGTLASLVGLAIEQGLIESYDDPITKYIPELLENDSAFSSILFRHIFEMRSGIKIRGKDASLFGDLAKTYYGNDFIRFMKTIEIEKPPGGEIVYNQTDAELVALILRRVTNMPLSEYLYQHIWSKIGGSEAFWNIYKKNDLERAYCCLNATAKDFAKLGRLYLHNGNWEGEQVLPKKWISFVTQYDKPPTNSLTFTFHKHWFPSTDGVGDYTAQGFNGQIIYVYPSENLIIVRLGKRKFDDEISWESIMRELAYKL